MGAKKVLYELAGPRAQALVDRARYSAGLLPRVEPEAAGGDTCMPWPEDRAACLVISADLELAWAWRYARVFDDPRAAALRLAEQSRTNLDALLALFERTDTPITWATVGHLFLDACDGAHADLPRPPHFANDLWSFPTGDWYEHDPGGDLGGAPEWFGPDVVDRILAAGVRHEIGCHTFSHVDFAAESCPPAVAAAELRATLDAAETRGITIETMVFPGNREGNLEALHAHGFRAYRLHGRHHLGLPRRDEHGMLQIPGGLCWETPPGWSPGAWAATLCRCIDKAIETNTLMHLWFHPSCDPVNLTEVFPAVLDHAVGRSDVLWRTTMKGVADLCDEQPSDTGPGRPR